MPKDAPRARRQVAGVVAALALLGGVGTLAALTGTAKQHAPTVGATRAAVGPPTVVFTDATKGWAFYPDCPRAASTDGCLPRLFRTADGGRSWKSVPLPVGIPTNTALWGRIQARGDAVVLPWQYGVYLSEDEGLDWLSPTLHSETAAVAPNWFVVREGDQLVVAAPSGTVVQALRPAIPVTPPWDLGVFGAAGLWIRDANEFAVSVTRGSSWNHTPVSRNALELVVPSPSGDRLARLQVALDRTTLGVAGDGGEYPVRGVLLSSDAGITWEARAVTGPPVNGACTVMLRDGSLLGVAVDGKALLRLSPGSTTFVPVSGGPATVPECLSSIEGLVYGPTFSGMLALSQDGVTWQSAALPVPR